MYVFIYLFMQGCYLQFEQHRDVKSILNNEMEGMEKETVVAHFDSLLRICPKGHK